MMSFKNCGKTSLSTPHYALGIRRVPLSQSICWAQALFPELCENQALFKGLSTDLLSLLPTEALSRTL